jgi:hypothetical protein
MYCCHRVSSQLRLNIYIYISYISRRSGLKQGCCANDDDDDNDEGLCCMKWISWRSYTCVYLYVRKYVRIMCICTYTYTHIYVYISIRRTGCEPATPFLGRSHRVRFLYSAATTLCSTDSLNFWNLKLYVWNNNVLLYYFRGSVDTYTYVMAVWALVRLVSMLVAAAVLPGRYVVSVSDCFGLLQRQAFSE